MRRRRLFSVALTAGASVTTVACWSLLGGDLAPSDAGTPPEKSVDASRIDGGALSPDGDDEDAASDTAPNEDAAPRISPGASGTLDTTFGNGSGIVTVSIPALTILQPDWSWPTPWLAAIVVQSDGKIVYGGHGFYDSTLPGEWPIILGRLKADGSVDTSFNPGGPQPGVFREVPPGYSNFTPTGQGAVQMLPSGDIAVGGYLSIPGDAPLMMVAEFTTSGVLDSRFGSGGVVALPGNILDRPPGGFLVAGDGTMFLGGEFELTAPTLVKLLATGLQGLAVESDGSALFVGSTGTTIELTHFVDGVLDPSFGDAGCSAPPIPGGNASAGSLVLASGGSIVVGATLPGSNSIGVVRYTSDGALDTSLGGAGYVGVEPAAGTTLGGPIQVAIDAYGRILCGTVVAVPNSGVPVVQIARFWP